MSALDAGFLYLERPHAPLTIGCVAIVDGALRPGALMRHLEGRLGTLQRYTQRAVPAPFGLAHPSWAADPTFDLRNHVRRAAVPRPGGEAELCEVVEELMARPLERTRPLWEMHVFEGLADGRTALVQRVHHCLIDGVAGAGVLERLLDSEPQPQAGGGAGGRPAAPGDASPAGGLREVVGSVADSTAGALRRCGEAYRMMRSPSRLAEGLTPVREVAGWGLRRMLDRSAAWPWSGPIGPQRRMAFTRFSLDHVRAIKAAHGCTVNDVVLAILGGGVRRYLEAVGIDPTRGPLAAVVPVSVRTASQENALGNRVAALLVPLVLAPSEEGERLALAAAVTRRVKEGRGHQAVSALLAGADLLPPPLVAWVGSRVRIPPVAGLIVTNVRGPAEIRHLAGHRVEALYPVVPIADGLGLGIAVLSYAGTLYLGFNADADRVPDLEKLRTGVEESFARLAEGLRR